MGAQGWFGAAIPERYGGLGLGRVELCAVAEELGRVIAPVPFASTVSFLAEALMLAGNEEQKARYLPQIAAAELIGCFATSEAPGPFTASRMEARVDSGKLTGKKIPVTDGVVAGLAVVAAKENGQPGLFLVDLARSAGVTRESLTTLDPTRCAAQITFFGTPAERLGAPGEGMSLVEAIMDRAAVLLAFEQLGGASGGIGGVLVRCEGKPPDSRRHGLHLGSRLPPLLPPLTPARACGRRAQAMERAASQPARAARRSLNKAYRGHRMDFNDTLEEAAFRAEARAWLEANVPKPTAAKRGDAAHLAAAKVWQAKKAAAGYAQIAWPKEWGGGGGTPIQSIIFAQEESKWAQNYGYFQIGLAMCVPTVLAFGDCQ
jgi:alkylation response protein AidB-like acyl-CoA dehydrogenase